MSPEEMWLAMMNETPEEKQLISKVWEFAYLFDDMLFKPDTISASLTMADVEGKKMQMSLPEEVELFTYDNYKFRVEVLEDADGYYQNDEKVLCIDSDSLNCDSVILHEMIHLHESVVNELSLYFHDALVFALYWSLRGKIDNLDDLIMRHAHVMNGADISILGGTHDILFLLKSFDLDLKMGYELGTVFGYDKKEEIKDR